MLTFQLASSRKPLVASPNTAHLMIEFSRSFLCDGPGFIHCGLYTGGASGIGGRSALDGVAAQGRYPLRIAGKAAISQARSKLGEEPLKRLWERTSKPLAQSQTPGAYYCGLLKVALVGTTLDIPETRAN
jgi:hypothetical protein